MKTTKKRTPKNHHHLRPHLNSFKHHPPLQTHHHHLLPLISLLASSTTSSHTFLTQTDLHLPPSQTLTLESKITSTALSLTKLHSLLQLPNPSQTPNPTPAPPPLSWFQRFLTAFPPNSKPQWVEAFRMSKPTFDLLLHTLAPSLQDSTCNVPVENILACGLFRLAHGAPYKAVGRKFGMDSAGACRAFYDVCKAVNVALGHLSELSSDSKRIADGFAWISLPNCCGVLGFSRFSVGGEAFGEDGGVVVQGLVDSEGRFLDVSAGWPSSMSPTDILPQTELFVRVEESKELLNGALFELENGNLIPQYLLGDSCCPLLPWLLTPYPVSNPDDDLNSNSSEQAFNSVHSRGMELVKTSFARVRACWQLLSVKWKEECIEFLPFVIVTSCLLHNFLIQCAEVVPDETKDFSQEQGFSVLEGKGNVNGERIRDVLAWQLSLHASQQDLPV